MTRDDILAVLSRFRRDHAEQYGIIRIGVFGSFARGEAGEQSDIDVVFETERPNLFRTARIKQELESLLARRVDVVRFREDMDPRLKTRIAREAQYV